MSYNFQFSRISVSVSVSYPYSYPCLGFIALNSLFFSSPKKFDTKLKRNENPSHVIDYCEREYYYPSRFTNEIISVSTI